MSARRIYMNPKTDDKRQWQLCNIKVVMVVLAQITVLVVVAVAQYVYILDELRSVSDRVTVLEEQSTMGPYR